jgi:preprotein translocase subunit SecD
MKHALVILAAFVFLLLFSCGGESAVGPRVHLVLAPAEAASADDLDEDLEAVMTIIERRIAGVEAKLTHIGRDDESRIVVEIAGLTVEEATDLLSQRGLLEFCQPVMDANGNVAVAREGEVRYATGSCEPERDTSGNPLIEGGTLEFVPWGTTGTADSASNPPNQLLVWEPAAADLGGSEVALTSFVVQPTTLVTMNQITNQPVIVLEWTEEGSKVSEQVTSRLAERNYPLAAFLDGEPLRDSNGLLIAPLVQATIVEGAAITGLELETAEQLAALLNGGAFPIPMRIVVADELREQ